MLKKRIIPCLDIKGGRTVKGVNFKDIKDAGDPVELAKLYSDQGADELVFLDITATQEKRKTIVKLADNLAREINIPFTIGGGIASIEDAKAALRSGADKVALNSAAVINPKLVDRLANRFGNQCIVCAVDAYYDLERDEWQVYISGGKKATTLELLSWCQELQNRGAGEILFTSMNHDGTKQGFANKALNILNTQLSIPVIASGGAGNMRHFLDVFNVGKADGALAASVFHYKEIYIPELKIYLNENGIKTRQL